MTTLPATPMLGRFTEVSLGKSLLREAKSGTPSVLLIGGEDGVGKTRFVEEIAEVARPMGFVVVTSRSRRDDSNVLGALTQIVSGLAEALGPSAMRQAMAGLPSSLGSFLPPLEAFREQKPDPGVLPDPEGEKLRLYEATRILLSRLCDKRPTLWVCDDLHNARDGELKLFAFLARTLTSRDRAGRGLPLLAIATYRVPLEDGSLKKLIVGARDQGFPFESIRLPPLTEPDTFEMARGLVPSFPEVLRKDLFGKTGGNPFFVREALKEASDGDEPIEALPDLPPSVKGLVRARLERFDEVARTVSCAAAALGDRFSLDLLRAVVTVPFGELLTTVGALVEENILDRDHVDRTFRFTHRFVKEAIYESSPAELRQRVHRAAAQVLEAEGDASRYARLAYHYEQTGEQERQVRNLLKAGLDALSRYDGREAGATLDRLLSVYDELPPESRQGMRDIRIKALSGLVTAARAQGESVRAVKAARHLLAVARKEKEPALLVKALRELAEVLVDTQERSQALAYLDEAIRIAREAGDREELARAISSKALQAQRLGDVLAIPLLDETIALAEEVGDQELLAFALVRKALSIAKTGDRSAEKLFEKALRIARAHRLPRVTAMARMVRGGFSAQKGNYDEGIRDFSAALAIHRKLGDLQGVGRGLVNLASLHAAVGNWEKAIGLHKKAATLLKGMGLRGELATSLFTIGNIECDRRRYSRAIDAYLEALSVFKELGDRHRIAECMNNIGITHFEMGDYQRARENLEVSTSLCLELDYALCGMESNLYLGAVSVLTGDVVPGMKALDGALEEATGKGFKNQEAVGHYLKGYVLASQGDPDGAAGELKEALAQAKQLGLLPAVERYKRTLAEVEGARRRAR